MKIFTKEESRECEAGDIVRVVGDTLYHALIVRKDKDQYEIVILKPLNENIYGQCQPGQMFVMSEDQIAAHINNIPLTVHQDGDADLLDFDENKLKEMGYELPQS